MQSNHDSMRKQEHHSSFPELQYYEIGQSNVSIPDSVHISTPDNASPQQSLTTTTAHLHSISLCANSGMLSQQHQLQEIIPGSVFGDPTLSHLHYHIYPSHRTISCSKSAGQSSGEPGCHGNGKLMEQLHQCDQYQHYQRQAQPKALVHQPPPPPLPPPATTLDGFVKERERMTSSNLNNFGRYTHVALESSEKCKNISLVELDSETQRMITGSKGKCQCHTIQKQTQQRLLRQKYNPDGRDVSVIEDDVSTAGHHRQQPPALPPRPPLRPSNRHYELTSGTSADPRHVGIEGGSVCCKKYVVLCCLCGGLSAAVGSLFLAVHAILSAHTASLALFETVPSYIPGTMLIFMGLFTMLLARRKHRYGFLMKVCGSVSVVCALVCVLVTITTTVVHMSRLQGLRECVYTARAKSCTCYGAPQARASDPGVLFEGTPDCEAVHGALYACLRALFGVSVAGILACIFSCMLVYQLLSHEKKKMYWEQLELRCRSLYGQGAGSGIVNARSNGACGCCNDCGGIGPWWAQSPGNLYTPNPDLAPSRRWRLPWSRSRGPAPSADAHYGFHSQAGAGNAGNVGTHCQAEGLMDVGGIVPYSILGPQSAYSMLQTTGHEDPYAQNNSSSPYNVLEAAIPLWGPPPPYSDPNSPARRPMLAFPATDHRTRLTKRIDNFPVRESEYSRSPDIKRPNSNYENTEQISNDADTEIGGNSEGKGARSNKRKKLLKGVENAAFQQQESNAIPKQSESELYFGDVSSCCGPESSLYDVATEKENKSENSQSEAGTSNYLSSHFCKHPSSKRARHQQNSPQQHNTEMIDLPSNSSCSSNGDEVGSNHSTAYSLNGPDIEYELIKQRYYGFDLENVLVRPMYSEKQHQQKQQEQQQEQQLQKTTIKNRNGFNDNAYGADEEVEEELDKDREHKDYRSNYKEDIRPVNV